MLNASENRCEYCGSTVTDTGLCHYADIPVHHEHGVDSSKLVCQAEWDAHNHLYPEEPHLDNLPGDTPPVPPEEDVGRSFKNTEFDNPKDYEPSCPDCEKPGDPTEPNHRCPECYHKWAKDNDADDLGLLSTP